MLAFIHTFLLQDILFQSEKVYTVLAVVLLVFASVIYLLVRQERKLSQLEKDMTQKEESIK